MPARVLGFRKVRLAERSNERNRVPEEEVRSKRRREAEETAIRIFWGRKTSQSMRIARPKATQKAMKARMAMLRRRRKWSLGGGCGCG
ncbi:hypothetical protein IEQ34_000727 [Dendrobium chrysotoxum]|uniref:Uncharacterized protein n=1 Tax=Dendrobium chrysotoxum TaxID=161865 RepID=A0AAV7HT79_DENCH|nr:hypothetical protein IEQ34_000727 [Dendrobium chrysotoxum]